MLAYANSLEFRGVHAENAAFRAVGAWLKEHLGYGLHPADLKIAGTHKGNRQHPHTWLRIEASPDTTPQLYTWTLKHPDVEIRGRQWVIEIGLQLHMGFARFTCVVRTDDASVLVTAPTTVFRPRVVGYLVRNISDYNDTDFVVSVPSLNLKRVGDDRYSYEALRTNVEHPDRDYPLIIVSPDGEKQYPIDIAWSSSQLIGLAQLVTVQPDYDRYEMEQTLGTQLGAWSGALNVIETRRPNGRIRSRVYRQAEVMSWGNTNRSRSIYLNGLVTAQSNVPLLRKRIRPEGVRALALRSKLERMHSGTVEEKERATLQSEQTWSMALELDDENSKLKSELDQADAAIKSLEIQLQDSESAARSLRYRISSLESERASPPMSEDGDIAESLIDLVCQDEEPSPARCLQVMSTVFADRCVVLPTAMESAEEYKDFKNGRRLLLMLRRLVTEYRDVMISGGDGKARKVFPNNEFAAQESESVTSNAAFRKRRVFIYKGAETEMFRHLKIGVNNSPRDMIRVHFAWDSDDKVIVIGHCGQHLPIPSR